MSVAINGTDGITFNDGSLQPSASVGKNLIINGDMRIWQRNTSVTGVSNAELVADRWVHVISGGTWDVARSTDVPTGEGFGYSLKVDCTATTTSHVWVEQKLEGQNLQQIKKGTSNAEKLTVSFWVKSNKTGTFIVWLRDQDNNRHCSQSYTISSANTWEYKTVTFPADTTGALDNDNALSLRVCFFLAPGSYDTGTLATTWESRVNANAAVGQTDLGDSTANEFLFTGVQLEANTTATPFEHLQYGQQLALCQRYFYTESQGDAYHNLMNGFYASTSLWIGVLHLPVPLRASPTLTVSGSWQTSGASPNSSTASGLVSQDNVVANLNCVQIRATVSITNAGQGATLRNDNDTSAKFELSSEL